MIKAFVFSVIVFTTFSTFSQENGTINGNLSDQEFSQEPLLFATVQLKNTGKVTQTNFHGNYEFKDVSPGEYTVVFSFLGYEAKEVVVHVKKDEILKINHQLKQKTLEFEETSTDVSDLKNVSPTVVGLSLRK